MHQASVSSILCYKETGVSAAHDESVQLWAAVQKDADDQNIFTLQNRGVSEADSPLQARVSTRLRPALDKLKETASPTLDRLEKSSVSTLAKLGSASKRLSFFSGRTSGETPIDVADEIESKKRSDKLVGFATVADAILCCYYSGKLEMLDIESKSILSESFVDRHVTCVCPFEHCALVGCGRNVYLVDVHVDKTLSTQLLIEGAHKDYVKGLVSLGYGEILTYTLKGIIGSDVGV